MEETVNIHLRYGNDTRILICKRGDILTSTAKKFGLKEEEIEFYEVSKDKTSSKLIEISNITKVMSIEVRKKKRVLTNQSNNVRQMPNASSHKAVKESSSDGQMYVNICSKLKENSTMNGKERQLLLSILQSLPPDLKRKIESGNFEPITKKNRKIQANPIDQISAYTQTDELINFDPKTSANTNSDNIIEQIKKYAKEEKKNQRVVYELMNESYPDRRNFILAKYPKINFVKEQYPLLFSLSEIYHELDRIVSHGASARFLENIALYAEPILSMCKESTPLFLTTREKEQAFSTTRQKKYAVEVGSILILTELIGEERTFLKLQDTNIDVSNYPYIEADAKINGIFFDQYTFKVYAEQMLICEAPNFAEAILCLIACYFVFNIQYPPEMFNTLVLMEKLYLEGIDTDIDDIDSATLQIIKGLQWKTGNQKARK